MAEQRRIGFHWHLRRIMAAHNLWKSTELRPLLRSRGINLSDAQVYRLVTGEDALAPSVVMFMASNLLHFSFGAWLLDHNVRLMTIWKVPSVLATFAGLAVGMSGVVVWEPLLQSIRMLGEISIPLMLFGLGVRMSDSRITSIKLGVAGAVARPLIGMAIAAALLAVMDFPPQQQALLLIFGALPPAVLNYIFAERYHQEPEKVASMVLIGNMAAVFFLPIALAFVLP